MSHALRIIDANANRAREAVRVMEDAARFLLDHQQLTRALKTLRHDLADALAALPGGTTAAIAHRDTAGDVGTPLSTPSEMHRHSMRDVTTAAAKRLTEALRVIEETAKTIPDGTPTAARVESLRYRAYDLERDLTLAMPTGRAPQWRLCLILTESLCRHHAWFDVARAAVEGGADCIQLREKNLLGAELIERARTLIDLARPRGVSVIVNDRVDVALAAGADGVHLGRHDIPLPDARRIAGHDLLLGLSTASIDHAEAALRTGADYCGVGPMFPSTTKPKDHIPGPDYLRRYLAHDPPLPPHLAIGGITPDNAPDLAAAGAEGVAVSAAICAADDPAQVCRALTRVLAHTNGVETHTH